jgi:hypothetical protein
MDSYDEYHCHTRKDVNGRSVDEGMADLMQVIWDYGLRTVHSCQGGPERPSFTWAWIQFWELSDGMKFLEGTAYLGNWCYADDLHLYLTAPILAQSPPSPVVMMNCALLPDITKLWAEGTAKIPEPPPKG